MKTKDALMSVLIVIGFLVLALSTTISIGYLLYNWGALSLALGYSAWVAFLLWLKMLVVGGSMVLVGFAFRTY